MAWDGTPNYLSSLANFGTNVSNPAYLEPFLAQLRKQFSLVRYGKMSSLPANSGKTVRWNVLQPLGAFTTSITEGTDPTETNATTIPYTATLAEYGTFSGLSKMLMKTAMSGTEEEIAEGLGYTAALTYDTLSQDALDGSTNTQDGGTAMTAEEIRKAAANLDGANIMPHPLASGNYMGFLSKEAFWDMVGEGAPTWIQAMRQELQNVFRRPMVEVDGRAALHSVIIKTSSNVQAQTAEDYNVVFGRDAFGVAALDTDPIAPNHENPVLPRLIRTSPEELTAAPLRNRGTIGWWGMYATTIFDVTRTRVILTDVT